MGVLSQLVKEFADMDSARAEVKQKAQEFFQAYADEMRKSSYGMAAKDFVQGMLVRAHESGLYLPPAKEGA